MKLGNIAARWLKVLQLILKGSGDNDLVERARGKREPDDLTSMKFDSDNGSSDDSSVEEGIDHLSSDEDTDTDSEVELGYEINSDSNDDTVEAEELMEDSVVISSEEVEEYDTESECDTSVTAEDVLDNDMYQQLLGNVNGDLNNLHINNDDMSLDSTISYQMNGDMVNGGNNLEEESDLEEDPMPVDWVTVVSNVTEESDAEPDV